VPQRQFPQNCSKEQQHSADATPPIKRVLGEWIFDPVLTPARSGEAPGKTRSIRVPWRASVLGRESIRSPAWPETQQTGGRAAVLSVDRCLETRFLASALDVSGAARLYCLPPAAWWLRHRWFFRTDLQHRLALGTGHHGDSGSQAAVDLQSLPDTLDI